MDQNRPEKDSRWNKGGSRAVSKFQKEKQLIVVDGFKGRKLPAPKPKHEYHDCIPT